MNCDEIYEDFYVMTIKENPIPNVCPGKSKDYALFHASNGVSSAFVGISYDFMIGYLTSALAGKYKTHTTLTNGLTERGRGGWFPLVTFNSLSTKKLEKILKDTHKDRIFSVDDFRQI